MGDVVAVGGNGWVAMVTECDEGVCLAHVIGCSAWARMPGLPGLLWLILAEADPCGIL